MSDVVTKIDTLCRGRSINYSQIFELAYQTSTKLKPNDFIEFNAVVQNLIGKYEKENTKRFSAGIRHILWAENYLYFLYKQKKFSEIKLFCEFYSKFQPKSNVDDFTFYNILQIYKFISGSQKLELDLKKLEIIFKKPKDELYTHLYLIWKSLEIVHTKIRDNLENFNTNPEILSALEHCLEYLELGISWDKQLQKQKFLRLETESYSYLKKIKTTISQVRGGNSNDVSSEENVQSAVKLFNESVKLFNEHKYPKAIENLKKACSLLQKSHGSEDKNKGKLEKCFALMGQIYYIQELYDDASTAFLESIYYSNFEEEKYMLYVDQFIRSNMRSNNKRSISTLFKKLSKDEMELLLNEELDAYKSYTSQYNKPTSTEQLSILDFMLKEIYEKESPEYLIRMIEREKILISKSYDLTSIQNAINICNQNIELLQNKNYDELALTYSFKEILKIHYHILMMKNKLMDWKDWKEDDNSREMCENIIKLMQTKFDFKYFKSSIKLWGSVLQQCSPQNIGKYIKNLERSFDQVELIAEFLEYYGETELQIDSLNLLKTFNKFREESNRSIDIKIAKVYIDLGYINRAEEILENLQDESDEEDILYENIIKGYLSLEKGSIEESGKIFQQIANKCKGKPKLLSLCRYYMAQVNFYQNDPDSIDISLSSLSSRMNKLSINNLNVIDVLNGASIDSTDHGSLISSLLQAGEFYESRGSLAESFHFYNQGLLLATITYSQIHVVRFLMNFGEMEQRKHKFTNSKYFFSAAQKICEISNFPSLSTIRIQNVSNLIQLADVYRIYQRYDDSKRVLDEVSIQLQNWKHPDGTNGGIDGTMFQSIKARLSLSFHMLEDSNAIDHSPDKKLRPTEEVLIHQFMAQKYLKSNENELAKSLYNKMFDLSGYLIPRFTRTSLSSLAILSQFDPYLSCYFARVSLRLKKLKLIKNQDLVESFAKLGIDESNLYNLHKSHDEGVDFVKTFQKTLPSNMIVCTIGISDDFTHLILSRITHKNEPILEMIPLIKLRDSIQALCDFHNVENLFEDFDCNESIKQDNQHWKYQMNKNVKESEESCLFSAYLELESIIKESDETVNIDKKSWWKRRYELDSRMKNLVEYLEYIILGDFTKMLFDLDYKKTGSNSKTILKTRRKKILEQGEDDSQPPHTVLILDKYLQKLPWENIPSLRSRSISRMPSILFLHQQLLNKPKLIDLSKTRYLLNPDGDLKNTQKSFEKYFEEENWKGTTNVPSNEEFKSMLEDSDFFIYMGHGGGEKYFRPSEISKLTNCAATLLMGCSSGKLNEHGVHEPNGTALNYILGNCPCLVANLWDVTDCDIDRFSLALLDCFTDDDSNLSLIQCVPLAREKCKLKYLIGCAPVCYGIPVFKK